MGRMKAFTLGVFNNLRSYRDEQLLFLRCVLRATVLLLRCPRTPFRYPSSLAFGFFACPLEEGRLFNVGSGIRSRPWVGFKSGLRAGAKHSLSGAGSFEQRNSDNVTFGGSPVVRCEGRILPEICPTGEIMVPREELGSRETGSRVGPSDEPHCKRRLYGTGMCSSNGDGCGG